MTRSTLLVALVVVVVVAILAPAAVASAAPSLPTNSTPRILGVYGAREQSPMTCSEPGFDLIGGRIQPSAKPRRSDGLQQRDLNTSREPRGSYRPHHEPILPAL